jgi:hypothetical protein
VSQVVVDLYLGAPKIFLSVSDGLTSKVSGIQQYADEIIVNGDVSSFAGIEYFNDYSVNFTNRSLVDKEYVDNKVSNNTFTGGSVNNISANGISATTISATTYYNLPTDIRVTGGTYSSGTATFTNNTGGTFNVTGFSTGTSFTGGTVTGATNFTGGLSASTISATTISATTIYVANMPELPFADGTTLDTYITGGNTFLRLKDNIAAPSGGTRTFNGNVNITSGLTSNTISATTYYNLPIDVRVTGGTYSSGTATFTNNTGGTFNVTGFSNGSSFTGGTVTGTTTFTNGLSANTMSATTFFGDGSNLTGISAAASQFVVNCRNQSGANMYRGQVVYISGSTGNKPTIRLAQANSEATSARTFGILKNDIANNADGDVVTIGAITNLDTRTSATHPFTVDTLVDGQTIYLSPTNAGYVTNIKPSAPNHLVYI